MKTRTASGGGVRALLFWCPACDEPHAPRIEGPGAWSWNGDRERPTLQPSILHHGDARPGGHRCHSFVTDGLIQFLPDSTHALAGHAVPIPDWPRPDYGGLDA